MKVIDFPMTDQYLWKTRQNNVTTARRHPGLSQAIPAIQGHPPFRGSRWPPAPMPSRTKGRPGSSRDSERSAGGNGSRPCESSPCGSGCTGFSLFRSRQRTGCEEVWAGREVGLGRPAPRPQSGRRGLSGRRRRSGRRQQQQGDSDG